MDAKTRADVRRLVQYALDTASTCHAAECEHVEVAAIAGRVRAILDAPAEAPLRGVAKTPPFLSPTVGGEWWRVNGITVACPSREDAERVAAALRDVLARMEKP